MELDLPKCSFGRPAIFPLGLIYMVSLEAGKRPLPTSSLLQWWRSPRFEARPMLHQDVLCFVAKCVPELCLQCSISMAEDSVLQSWTCQNPGLVGIFKV